MESNRTIFSIIKSDEEKTKIIVHNILKMLGNRIYIDNNGQKKQLLDPIEASKTIKDTDEKTYVVDADNGDSYAIKIIFFRISAIGKQSTINEFLKEYGKYKKIIVASDYNNKIVDYVRKHQTQIFKEGYFLSDLLKYRDQPRFELLSPKEMEQVKLEYHVTDYTVKKMPRNDAIAKYFALKKGDIIRIIRPSPVSGEAIDYRIVS